MKVGTSNVELLAQAFAGWGKDRPANMREVLHPRCELVVPESIPYGGTFRGLDPVVDWFSRGKLIRGRVYADTAVLREAVEGITPS